MSERTVVCIGVRHFENADELLCTVNDAVAAYILFRHDDYGRLPAADISLLVDGTSPELLAAATTVTNWLQSKGLRFQHDIIDEVLKRRIHPDRENIMNELDRMAQYTRGRFIVYACSHGMVLNDETYLLCSLSKPALLAETAISLAWMERRMRRSRASSKILIKDLCYCGSPVHAVPLTERWLRALRSPMRQLQSVIRNTRDATSQLTVLSSCGPTEFAHEDAKIGHGIYTNSVVRYILAHRNQEVNVAALHDYAFEQTTKWVALHQPNRRQTPTLNGYAMRSGGTVALIGDDFEAAKPDRRRVLRLAGYTGLLGAGAYLLTNGGSGQGPTTVPSTPGESNPDAVVSATQTSMSIPTIEQVECLGPYATIAGLAESSPDGSPITIEAFGLSQWVAMASARAAHGRWTASDLPVRPANVLLSEIRLRAVDRGALASEERVLRIDLPSIRITHINDVEHTSGTNSHLLKERGTVTIRGVADDLVLDDTIWVKILGHSDTDVPIGMWPVRQADAIRTAVSKLRTEWSCNIQIGEGARFTILAGVCSPPPTDATSFANFGGPNSRIECSVESKSRGAVL